MIKKLSNLKLKDLKNKSVLVRVDFNVKFNKNRILNEHKIQAAFETINYLRKNKAKVILVSHLGRPNGRRVKKYSLKPIARYLSQELKINVVFSDKVFGVVRNQKLKKLKPGGVMLLENIRFNPGEEKNDFEFAKKMAEKMDLYVNDAFSVCHREHASVAAITEYLNGYAGQNIINEIKNLDKVLKPKKPAVAVIGGVKISTKIKVIENLLPKVDYIIIGGALANNFLAAQKINIGTSYIEKEYIALAKRLLKENPKKIILPEDFVITRRIQANSKTELVSVENLKKKIRKNFLIADIGPQTIAGYSKLIKKSETIIWNGPMGVFEIKKFRSGTTSLAMVIASRSKGHSFGVVGGGETVAALDLIDMKEYIDFVSTGGGAMLKYLEGAGLVGLDVLNK